MMRATRLPLLLGMIVAVLAIASAIGSVPVEAAGSDTTPAAVYEQEYEPDPAFEDCIVPAAVWLGASILSGGVLSFLGMTATGVCALNSVTNGAVVDALGDAAGGVISSPIGVAIETGLSYTLSVASQTTAKFLIDGVLGGLGSDSNFITQTPPSLTYKMKAVWFMHTTAQLVAYSILSLIIVWAGLGIMVKSITRAPYPDVLALFGKVFLAALAIWASLWIVQFMIDLNNGAICTFVAAFEAAVNQGADCKTARPPGFDAIYAADTDMASVIFAAGYTLVLLALVVLMAMRIAMIDVLIILAPIAFALWVLPQTETWSGRWFNIAPLTIFQQFAQVMVLMFGIVIVASMTTDSVSAYLDPADGGTSVVPISDPSEDVLFLGGGQPPPVYDPEPDDGIYLSGTGTSGSSEPSVAGGSDTQRVSSVAQLLFGMSVLLLVLKIPGILNGQALQAGTAELVALGSSLAGPGRAGMAMARNAPGALAMAGNLGSVLGGRAGGMGGVTSAVSRVPMGGSLRSVDPAEGIKSRTLMQRLRSARRGDAPAPSSDGAQLDYITKSGPANSAPSSSEAPASSSAAAPHLDYISKSGSTDRAPEQVRDEAPSVPTEAGVVALRAATNGHVSDTGGESLTTSPGNAAEARAGQGTNWRDYSPNSTSNGGRQSAPTQNIPPGGGDQSVPTQKTPPGQRAIQGAKSVWREAQDRDPKRRQANSLQDAEKLNEARAAARQEATDPQAALLMEGINTKVGLAKSQHAAAEHFMNNPQDMERLTPEERQHMSSFMEEQAYPDTPPGPQPYQQRARQREVAADLSERGFDPFQANIYQVNSQRLNAAKLAQVPLETQQEMQTADLDRRQAEYENSPPGADMGRLEGQRRSLQLENDAQVGFSAQRDMQRAKNLRDIQRHDQGPDPTDLGSALANQDRMATARNQAASYEDQERAVTRQVQHGAYVARNGPDARQLASASIYKEKLAYHSTPGLDSTVTPEDEGAMSLSNTSRKLDEFRLQRASDRRLGRLGGDA